MKNIKLNPEQIVDLINNKRVFLDSDTVVEVFDDEIIYNNNGRISRLDNLHLEFSPPEKDKPFLRKLLCEYLNCKPFEIICTDISNQEAAYKVRFSPDKELELIVVSSNQAKRNVQNTSNNEDTQNLISENQIGLYQRLGNSDYFFRWEIY